MRVTGSPRHRSTTKPAPRRAGPHGRGSALLAEGAALAGDPLAEAGPKTAPTAGEPIEDGDLARDVPRAPARQRRDHRPQAHALGGQVHGGQRDPRMVATSNPSKVMTWSETKRPTCFLFCLLGGTGGEHADVGELTEGCARRARGACSTRRGRRPARSAALRRASCARRPAGRRRALLRPAAPGRGGRRAASPPCGEIDSSISVPPRSLTPQRERLGRPSRFPSSPTTPAGSGPCGRGPAGRPRCA